MIRVFRLIYFSPSAPSDPRLSECSFARGGLFVPEEFVLRVFGCVIRMLSSFVDVMADRGGLAEGAVTTDHAIDLWPS